MLLPSIDRNVLSSTSCNSAGMSALVRCDGRADGLSTAASLSHSAPAAAQAPYSNRESKAAQEAEQEGALWLSSWLQLLEPTLGTLA
jgi:hypothetical protein